MVAPVHVGTILVENSDERLSAVEEAKRTGKPFQSVAANETELVPEFIAWEIAQEFSQKDTYVGRFGATHAAHLEDYHKKLEDPDFIAETNEEKADAHARYSAELVRQQMKDEKRVEEMIAEGYDPSLAVQQANLERAREHENKSADYVKLRLARAKDRKPALAVIDESVRILNADELMTPMATMSEKASALEAVTGKPDAMEDAAREALVLKDKIIETAVSYKKHAAAHKELVHRDRPGIEIMDAAGSPEALRESTGLAQAYADNRTPEAAKAVLEVSEVVAEHDGEEVTTAPGTVLREAEATVPGGRNESDEMPENPSE